jgi:DNA-binding Lrp family transcriptional regulator
MGDVDFVVISRAQDRSQINEIIDEMVAVDGVNETSSRFVMKELKTETKPLANMSRDMREAVVDFDG